MKILILGAGRVGTSVAENLVSEQNDITLIDTDARRLAQLQERLDLRGVVGNGTHIDVLAEAGAADADLLIACATSDETNLVACKIAKQVFNLPRRIARARAPAFLDHPELMGEQGFCVDHLISPERSVTSYLESLIEYPETLQVLEFAQGRVTLAAVRVVAGSPLVGQAVETLRKRIPDIDSRIVAIYRQDKPLIPTGATIVEAGDELFCLADAKHLKRVIAELVPTVQPVRRVMIAGGGNIGARLARELGGKYQIKLIEVDQARCELLASQLPARTLVLNGDATDEDLLEDENVADMDMFLALTNDDENNIMSSLLAKRMGARRVVALIGRKAYGDLMEGGRIDVAISPSQATIGELLRHVRRGDIVVVHQLRRGAAEAIEAVAHGDRKNSNVIGRRIEEISLPKGSIIGALVRGEDVLMAHHDTVIEPEDHVIVFVTNSRLISKVEQLFQVSASFF
jgi:trk system potassium uptake protein TrkA